MQLFTEQRSAGRKQPSQAPGGEQLDVLGERAARVVLASPAARVSLTESSHVAYIFDVLPLADIPFRVQIAEQGRKRLPDGARGEHARREKTDCVSLPHGFSVEGFGHERVNLLQ